MSVKRSGRSGMRFVQVGPRRVGWVETGSGTPLVLVHGLGASGSWWRRLLPYLGTERRVLMVDLSGFGSARGQGFRLDEAADIIADWLGSLGIPRAAVAGHSLGGIVAADLAARHPDLVARLILIDSAGMPLQRRVGGHFVNAARGWRRMPPRMVPVAVFDYLRAGPLTIARAGHQILATDLTERLRSIVAPTQVIWGAEDPLLPAELGHRIAETIGNARLELLPGIGHNPMWEAPEQLARAMNAFLDEPLPAPEGSVRAQKTSNFTLPAELCAPTGGRIVSRYLSVGDWSLHVRVGRPDEPIEGAPIVLVHGFVISSRYHVPTMKRLARRRLVLAPDLPGFGWSSKPDRVLDVPGLAGALLAFLDAAGIDRPVIIGNSLGSQIAAEFAFRFPERLDRLILTGPTFDPSEPSLAKHVLRLVADIPREKPTLWFLHLPDYVLTGPGRALQTLRHAWSHRIETVLPHIRVPTLVVRGTRDTLVPRHWARQVARLLPHARLAEIPKAAHAVNHGAPDSLAFIVETFLDREGDGAPAETSAKPS